MFLFVNFNTFVNILNNKTYVFHYNWCTVFQIFSIRHCFWTLDHCLWKCLRRLQLYPIIIKWRMSLLEFTTEHMSRASVTNEWQTPHHEIGI